MSARAKHRLEVRGLTNAVDDKRALLRLSLTRLARELGLSQSSLTHFRQGKRRPDVDAYITLCCWLGYPLPFRTGKRGAPRARSAR